jgi:TonB family protein
MKPITIMLIASVCLHVAVFALLQLVPWFSHRKIQAPIYSVTLVTQAAPKPTTPQPKTEIKKEPPPKPPKKTEEKPVTVKKPKPKPKPEPKKKVAVKVKRPREDTISEKYVQRKMESRIEELRKKAEVKEKPKESERVAEVAPKPSRAVIDKKLRTYYNEIWQRIKEEWILPGSLMEESEEWETVIVIKVQRDGGVVESWFEKKSGSGLYDESAMRAIKKANPLPPFPQELEDDALEIGIRFIPSDSP